MKYVALLRGINVGKSVRVSMKQLKSLVESLGYTGVSTYINSGNVLFETAEKKDRVRDKIGACLRKETGSDVPVLVKSAAEMEKIAAAIPDRWKNDDAQRTDVAYLFPETDNKKTADDLPFNRDVVNIRYVKGAVIWNLARENYRRSRLEKLIGHRLYSGMTMRNVNTARYLAGSR